MREEARSFAISAHAEQKYGNRSYSCHLDAMAELAEPFGEDATVVAYLHDTVEDTATTIGEICDRFGPRIAACVSLLTDEPGIDRRERKAKTYAKPAGVHGPNELALVVKAADRLANVRACIADRNRELWHVYRSEHAVFRASAYRDGLCDDLWAELDSLLSDRAFDRDDTCGAATWPANICAAGVRSPAASTAAGMQAPSPTHSSPTVLSASSITVRSACPTGISGSR